MKKEYITIGKNACIERLGKAFVEEHRADACFGTQEMDDKLFCFLGIDLHADNRKLRLSNENDWDVYSSCYVSDGTVELGDCRLPI